MNIRASEFRNDAGRPFFIHAVVAMAASKRRDAAAGADDEHPAFAWGAPLIIVSMHLTNIGARTQAWTHFAT